MTASKTRAAASIPINPAAIRAAREDRGLTMAQLAAQIGVDRSYISRLESGSSPRCSAPVHAALVRALRPEHKHAFRTDKVNR